MGKLYKIFIPISCGASLAAGFILMVSYKDILLGIWILATSALAFITYELRDKV